MPPATVQATERAGAPTEELVCELEIGLPERVAVGKGTAFLIGGYCYHPSAPTRTLELELGPERQPIDHFRLPRLDAYERAGGESAYRSGFLATARVAPLPQPIDAEVRLLATMTGGARASAPLGTVRLEPAPEAPGEPPPSFPEPAGARVAICMATFEPPRELLRRQLDSLRRQTHRNWICVVSDDGSSPEALAALREEIREDPRFLVTRSAARLGFYANFERALGLAPETADFITLCDQDDRWHPRKLERLLERMKPGVELAYSDARIVDAAGEVIHPSYWTARRNNYDNLGSLLVANTVTGAASLFRRELLDDLLPFPPRLSHPYHDHWLSLVALARGRISYTGEPLYDYVQHPGAVIGHSRANQRPLPIRERIRDRLRRPGDGSRIVYYYVWSQQRLFAEVLRLRCWNRMTPRKRRALRRFLAADRGVWGIAWLLARLARPLWGRNETLGIERHYAKALLRQRAVARGMFGRRRPGRWLRRDASIPPPPVEET